MQEPTGRLGRAGLQGTLSRSTLQAREAGRTLSRAAETQHLWLRLRRIGPGVKIEVKVQPRASRNELERDSAGAFKLKLTSPPVEGEANRAAIEFLAKRFGVSRSNVRLVRGEKSRHKVFEIEGGDPGRLPATQGVVSKPKP